MSDEMIVNAKAAGSRARVALVFQAVIVLLLAVVSMYLRGAQPYLGEKPVKILLNVVGVAIGLTLALAADRWRVICSAKGNCH